jgi:uncharacterized protein
MQARARVKILLLHVILCPFLLASTAYSASFDCSKARTKTEITICDTPTLGRLDEQLASTYRQALQTGGEKTRIEQREWLKQVAKCPDARCINDLYVARIAELSLPSSSGSSRANKSAQQEGKAVTAGPSSKPSTDPNRLGF